MMSAFMSPSTRISGLWCLDLRIARNLITAPDFRSAASPGCGYARRAFVVETKLHEEVVWIRSFPSAPTSPPR